MRSALPLLFAIGCGFDLGDTWTLEVHDGAVLLMGPDEWDNPMRCTVNARGSSTTLTCDERPTAGLTSAQGGALRSAARDVAWDGLVSAREEDLPEGGGMTGLHLTQGDYDRRWDLSNTRNRTVIDLIREVSRVRRDVAGPGAPCEHDTSCHWGYCDSGRCVSSTCQGDDGTYADGGPPEQACSERNMRAIRDRGWHCIDRRTCAY